jgi:hypothetical protein
MSTRIFVQSGDGKLRLPHRIRKGAHCTVSSISRSKSSRATTNSARALYSCAVQKKKKKLVFELVLTQKKFEDHLSQKSKNPNHNFMRITSSIVILLICLALFVIGSSVLFYLGTHSHKAFRLWGCSAILSSIFLGFSYCFNSQSRFFLRTATTNR